MPNKTNAQRLEEAKFLDEQNSALVAENDKLKDSLATALDEIDMLKAAVAEKAEAKPEPRPDDELLKKDAKIAELEDLVVKLKNALADAMSKPKQPEKTESKPVRQSPPPFAQKENPGSFRRTIDGYSSWN